MATSHILSAIEPTLANSTGLGPLSTNLQNSRSPDLDRNLNVSLDDRELWMRFQNLTNEMIVTKNGRFVYSITLVKNNKPNKKWNRCFMFMRKFLTCNVMC